MLQRKNRYWLFSLLALLVLLVKTGSQLFYHEINALLGTNNAYYVGGAFAWLLMSGAFIAVIMHPDISTVRPVRPLYEAVFMLALYSTVRELFDMPGDTSPADWAILKITAVWILARYALMSRLMIIALVFIYEVAMDWIIRKIKKNNHPHKWPPHE